MIPGSFDTETAKEYIGDKRMLVIEKKAREDADLDTLLPPNTQLQYTNYAAGVHANMENQVYFAAYRKRKERAARIASNEGVAQVKVQREPIKYLVHMLEVSDGAAEHSTAKTQ